MATRTATTAMIDGMLRQRPRDPTCDGHGNDGAYAGARRGRKADAVKMLIATKGSDVNDAKENARAETALTLFAAATAAPMSRALALPPYGASNDDTNEVVESGEFAKEEHERLARERGRHTGRGGRIRTVVRGPVVAGRRRESQLAGRHNSVVHYTTTTRSASLLYWGGDLRPMHLLRPNSTLFVCACADAPNLIQAHRPNHACR